MCTGRYGCGGGLVVSVLACYSSELSLNPVGNLPFVRKDKNKGKELGLAHLKKCSGVQRKTLQN